MTNTQFPEDFPYYGIIEKNFCSKFAFPKVILRKTGLQNTPQVYRNIALFILLQQSSRKFIVSGEGMCDDFMALLAILWLYAEKCLVDSRISNRKVFGRKQLLFNQIICQYLTRRSEESTKNHSLIGDDRPVIEPDISRAQVCNCRYGKLFGLAV